MSDINKEFWEVHYRERPPGLVGVIVKMLISAILLCRRT